MVDKENKLQQAKGQCQHLPISNDISDGSERDDHMDSVIVFTQNYVDKCHRTIGK